MWDIYGEYNEWVNSEGYKKWKEDHENGKAMCNRVVKLDCIGHVQKMMGKALRDFKKKEGKTQGWEEYRREMASCDGWLH